MYDPRWPGGPRPDLRKLPQVVREQLSQPVPLRPTEVHAGVLLFQTTPGLNHPNGRVLVSSHRKDPEAYTAVPDGIQIDLTDFYGRKPLASIVLTPAAVVPVLENLIRCYVALGATAEDVQQRLSNATLPAERLQATTYYEDEGSRE